MLLNIYFFEDSQECRNKRQLPSELLPRGQVAVLPFVFQYIVTKQNACSVTCKCVCIPVSKIHSIPKISHFHCLQLLRHETLKLTNPGLSNAKM